MTVRETFDDSGDPPSGSRLDSKFYAADAKEHAQQINANTAAITALSNFETAYVATSEGISSAAFGDLATTTDSVTIDVGASGKVLVFISSWIVSNAAGRYGVMSFAVSGANTQAASDAYSIQQTTRAADATRTGGVGAMFPLTGLNPGSTTFKLKYYSSIGTSSFEHRRITVIALP